MKFEKPIVINQIVELQMFVKANSHKTIGFTPTMGALHQGHAQLLKRSRAENDISVLSIFVNPTQFNDKNDFEKYPKTWEQDLEIAILENVDVIFAPFYSDLYPENYTYKVIEILFSKELCGENRPGHFDGVLSIVMKLLNIVKPQKAYFGEKDFQQLSLIQGMVKAFFLNVEIVPIKTVREVSGLALSSRNLRLSPLAKQTATKLNQTIKTSLTPEEAFSSLKKLGFTVEYVKDIKQRRFVAAQIESVRLIDNVEI